MSVIYATERGVYVMNDNDVIKALECCMGMIEGECEECPMCNKEYCKDALMGYSRNLINRLQAENEKWQSVVFKQDETRQMLAAEKQGYLDELQYANAEIERLTEENEDIKGNWRKMKTDQENTCEECRELFANAKSEARKEFAYLITDRARVVQINAFDYAYQITEEQIDNLLEEMDGKENA